jgi:hypothetical protein
MVTRSRLPLATLLHSLRAARQPFAGGQPILQSLMYSSSSPSSLDRRWISSHIHRVSGEEVNNNRTANGGL